MEIFGKSLRYQEKRKYGRDIGTLLSSSAVSGVSQHESSYAKIWQFLNN